LVTFLLQIFHCLFVEIELQVSSELELNIKSIEIKY
jgi:hypothetical protein